MRSHIILIGLVLLSLFSPVWAETTCEAKDCKITITIKIAFAFDQRVQNQDDYMKNVKDEIEKVWNNGNPTFGDCKCPVSFKVETKKITNASQVNCNPGPPGYHCIMVTDYNNNPPRNQSNWTGAQFYAGYMYGIATGNGGNSQKGWWSNIMSRAVPGSATGEHYVDYAHEAGHMMGLEDGDGGIMNTTNGPNAKPTQAHIDEIVNEICGANACPDRCCCGNGKIDRDKGEQCDPMVGGCPSDEYCCPVCCHCYGKVCFPEWGEYMSQQECQASCGPNAKCYYNYQTGCWDCVQNVVVIHEIPYDDSKVQQITDEAHYIRNAELDAIRNLYEQGLLAFPTIGDFLGNERANIMIEGGNSYHALTDEGELYEVSGGAIDDPTLEIITDVATLDEINSGTLSPLVAYKEDRIKINGIGFVEGIKFWFAEFMVDNFAPSDVVGPLAPVEEPEETGEVLVQETEEQIPSVPASGEQFPEHIPDDTLKEEVEVYEEFNFTGDVVYAG
jgi:hypothetical protein